MSEISEAAMAKACEFFDPWRMPPGIRDNVAEFIQQVSDAAKASAGLAGGNGRGQAIRNNLAPFILPDPVDPLVLVCSDLFDNGHLFHADKMRDILAKRGLEIREIGK